MELVILLLLAGLGIAAFFWWRSAQTAGSKGGAAIAPKTVANLEPGDGIGFWDGGSALVENVLRCGEEVNQRFTEWQWVLLSDGRLLEVAPDGNMLYDAPEILHQGSAPFDQLTGEQGVLRAFEQRVREGVSGSQPVHFEHGDVNYQVKSTGVFFPVRGQPVPQEVWRDISPNAGDNVYFEMESASGAAALGLWTTHIAWYVGQPLKETDIDTIYPKHKEGRS